MPYALSDRDSFIERTGLEPGMNVLSMSPDHAIAIKIDGNVENSTAAAVHDPELARGMRATAHSTLNTVISEYAHLPFKDSMFDIIFSYHTLNHIPSEMIPHMMGEVRRMVKDNSRFVALVWSLNPTNEAQTSHKMLLDILAQLGLVHLPGFDDISRWLEAAGFEEITMELVTSDLTVPAPWARLHQKRLDDIITEGAHQIGEEVRSYKKHVEEYGEELLPSIQFCARRGESPGIDIVK